MFMKSKELPQISRENTEDIGRFIERKNKALDWSRAPKQTDSRGIEEPLDGNIADLVRAMNDCPFLYTTASCGGHFYSCEEIRKKYPYAADGQFILPNEGYVVGGGGYIKFVIDTTDESKRFVAELKKITARYPNAGLTEKGDGNYSLEFIKQLDEDDAFTMDETEQVKTQIKKLLVEIKELITNFVSFTIPKQLGSD